MGECARSRFPAHKRVDDFNGQTGRDQRLRPGARGGQRESARARQPLFPRWRHAGARPTRRAHSWHRSPGWQPASSTIVCRCCLIASRHGLNLASKPVATQPDPQPALARSAQPRARASGPRQPAVAAKTGPPVAAINRADGPLPNSVEALPEGGSLGGGRTPRRSRSPGHRRMKPTPADWWVAPLQLDPCFSSALWALSPR